MIGIAFDSVENWVFTNTFTRYAHTRKKSCIPCFLWFFETLLMGNRVHSWLWFFNLRSLLSLIESNRIGSMTTHHGTESQKNNIPNFSDDWTSIAFFKQYFPALALFLLGTHCIHIHEAKPCTGTCSLLLLFLCFFIYMPNSQAFFLHTTLSDHVILKIYHTFELVRFD